MIIIENGWGPAEFWSYFVPALKNSTSEIKGALLWFIPIGLFAIWYCWRAVFKPLSTRKSFLLLFVYFVATLAWVLLAVGVPIGLGLFGMPERYQTWYLALVLLTSMWGLGIFLILVVVLTNYFGYKSKQINVEGSQVAKERIVSNFSWPLINLAFLDFGFPAIYGSFVVTELIFPGKGELTTAQKVPSVIITGICFLLTLLILFLILRIPRIVNLWFPDDKPAPKTVLQSVFKSKSSK